MEVKYKRVPSPIEFYPEQAVECVYAARTLSYLIMELLERKVPDIADDMDEILRDVYRAIHLAVEGREETLPPQLRLGALVRKLEGETRELQEIVDVIKEQIKDIYEKCLPPEKLRKT